jgi:hypothetical protein
LIFIQRIELQQREQTIQSIQGEQKSMQTALRALSGKCTALEREATRMRKHAATSMPSLQTSNRVPSNAKMSISTDQRTSSVASASVEHSDLPIPVALNPDMLTIPDAGSYHVLLSFFHGMAGPAQDRFIAILRAQTKHTISSKGVRAVARAVSTSVPRQYQLNMRQFDAWVRDVKTSICGRYNIQTSVTGSEEGRTIVAYVDVATVFREQIAVQSILKDTLKKRDFLNVLVYLDGRRITRLTGSTILNVAFVTGMQAKHSCTEAAQMQVASMSKDNGNGALFIDHFIIILKFVWNAQYVTDRNSVSLNGWEMGFLLSDNAPCKA